MKLIVQPATKPIIRPAIDENNRKGWNYSHLGMSVFGITVADAYLNWQTTPHGLEFCKENKT